MKLITILHLRAYYEPEVTPSVQMTDDLENRYLENNIRNINITPVPSRGVDRKTTKKYKKIKTEIKKSGSIVVHRFYLFRERRNIVLRAFRYFLASVIAFFIAIRQKNIDIVHAGSTPPTQGLLAAFVAKILTKKYKRKVACVYNLQDIFPDSLVTAKLIKKNSILWKGFRKLEVLTYKHVDKIIVISDDFKKNLLAKGVPEFKISIVPNWVNTELVHPVDRNANFIFEKFNLDKNKFYFSYCGNIGMSQNFELLVLAARKIQNKYKNICFVIVGDGSQKEYLLEQIKIYKLNNIVLIPFQSKEFMSNVFNLGDVGMVISKKGIGKSSVPSKTWNIMAAQKPVLASFDIESEFSYLIKKINCGLISDSEDVDSFVKNLIYMYENKDVLKEFAANGYLYVKENLDINICTKAYINELTNMVQ